MMQDLAARTMRKLIWRLLPFCMLLFFCNYLDRVNIGFAALQMNQALKLTPDVFGLGAGIFFIGYVLFEIPSNLIMQRTGARLWIARIAITWGLLSSAMIFVDGRVSFFTMRFLLGVAEAGLLPGLFLYFTYWFPAAERGKAYAIFMSATALSNVAGGPLSAALLGLDGLFGLHGWQLLFLIEGIPSVVMGVLVVFVLTEQPSKARWLTTEERGWLVATLAAERAAKEAARPMTLKTGLSDPRVLLLAVLCFFLVSGNFGVVFWMPQIIKGFGGLSNMQTGLLSAVPYLLAVFAMIWWGRRSDRMKERRWHLAAAALLGSLGLAGSALATQPVLAFAALCVAAIGIWSMFGVFWALPAEFLSGTAAAGGLALINGIGTLGGFAGPYLVGLVRAQTGNFSGSLFVLAAFVLVSAILAATMKTGRRAAPA